MRPLLCELHPHTSWSDGELSLGAVVDLYGAAGFDVLCVTDHVLRSDDPWPLRHGRPCLDVTNVGAYLAELERERARALSAYGLLLVPGLELTYNDPDPDSAAHALAVGLHGLVAMDDGPAAAMETARAAGAAILVAQPHDFEPTAAVLSPTCYFARRWRELRGLFDRVELFNGQQLFSWVAETGLRAVACGDLHRAEHLPGWKTLVPCEQDEEALRRLPAFAPARVPDAPRAAHDRARRVASLGPCRSTEAEQESRSTSVSRSRANGAGRVDGR